MQRSEMIVHLQIYNLLYCMRRCGQCFAEACFFGSLHLVVPTFSPIFPYNHVFICIYLCVCKESRNKRLDFFFSELGLAVNSY